MYKVQITKLLAEILSKPFSTNGMTPAGDIIGVDWVFAQGLWVQVTSFLVWNEPKMALLKSPWIILHIIVFQLCWEGLLVPNSADLICFLEQAGTERQSSVDPSRWNPKRFSSLLTGLLNVIHRDRLDLFETGAIRLYILFI